MKLLVFDTETTGLPPKNTPLTSTDAWPYIVQLSYIVYDTDTQTILLLNDSIVKCCVPIPVETSKIHGITDAISQEKGLNPAELLSTFLKTAEDVNLIVAHNLSFDRDIIAVECLRRGINCDVFINQPMYCTMKSNINRCALARENKMGNTYFKFPNLAELHYHLFQTWPEGMHNAKADVLICLRCYVKINHKTDIAALYPDLFEEYINNNPFEKQVLHLWTFKTPIL